RDKAILDNETMDMLQRLGVHFFIVERRPLLFDSCHTPCVGGMPFNRSQMHWSDHLMVIRYNKIAK
ncbi:hypothetical protein P9762_09600, partial [Geobacillus stearothermophilus]|uniref:hypothetical protein n=1 Tax=Geobacillus stearothermophilus TaxID=1422 RepID=UPI002E1EE6F6|nr:hypothetical protein [Geobacillus stearothermophilus]